MIVLIVVLAFAPGYGSASTTSFTQEFTSRQSCEDARNLVVQNTNAKVLLAQCTPK